MKPTRDLFDLIKSLNRTEKRYVSLYLSTSLHGSNEESLRLFQAISKQSEFDDEHLKKQMGKAFSRRFSAEKNRLYELVLDSMLSYYRESSVERKLMQLRHKSMFLFQKRLRTQGWKYFQKAVAMADEEEAFPIRQLLIRHECLEASRPVAGEAPFDVDALLTLNETLQQKFSDDLTLQLLYTQTTRLEMRYGITDHSEEAAAAFEKVFRHPAMSPARKLTSFLAQLYRFSINSIYYASKGDTAKDLEFTAKMIELYDAHPKNRAITYGRYCDILLNWLQLMACTREYKAFDAGVAKVRKALQGMKKISAIDVSYLDFAGIQLSELIVYKHKADITRGPAFVAQAEKRFALYRDRMVASLVVEFLFHAGTYHFYTGNLKKALAHYNDLLDTTEVNAGRNFHCMTHLIKLLLHFDLGHDDLLESLVKSTTRFLRKEEHFGKFEQALLSFFAKIPSGEKATWQKLRAELAPYSPARYRYGAVCEFDFAAWIESKLQKKSFRELVAEHA